MSFDYRDWSVKVYRQGHRDYPPWVATAQIKVDGKIRMFNVEGQTMDQAAEKIKARIDGK